MAEQGYMRGYPMSQYPFAQQQPGTYQQTPHISQEEAYQNAPSEFADNVAFEAAFAQAEDVRSAPQEASQRDLSSTGEVAGVRLDPILNPNQDTLLFPNIPPQQESTIRIGSDIIPASKPTTQKTPEQQTRDADELARCAGALLTSVEGDTSAKFENSTFLALMRKIRDREVVVEGEEFKEVSKDQSGDASRQAEVLRTSDHQTQDLHAKVQSRQKPLKGSALSEFERSHGELVEQNRRLSMELEEHRKLRERELEAGLDQLHADGGADVDVQTKEDYNMRWKQQERRRMREAKVQWERARMENQREELVRQSQELARLKEEAQALHQALHPGGRRYPTVDDDDRHKYDHWASGGIGIEDDDKVEESLGLAGRFRRMDVEDQAEG
jgi:hypothetical protein